MSKYKCSRLYSITCTCQSIQHQGRRRQALRLDGTVRVLDSGVDIVTVGQQASFVIDTSEVGAGNLSVTVDGPSNVNFLKYYLKFTLFIVLKVY